MRPAAPRRRQQDHADAGDPMQQPIAPQPAGDTGQGIQRHPHARQGPGGGISGDQGGAACADRVDHQRDGAGQLAGDRQAVAELDPLISGSWSASRTVSIQPSRPGGRVPHTPRMPRGLGSLVWSRCGGRVARHRSGTAPDGQGGWFSDPREPHRAIPARQGWPARAPPGGSGTARRPHRAARSPAQQAPRFSFHRHCARSARRSQDMRLFPLAGWSVSPYIRGLDLVCAGQPLRSAW